MQPKTIAGSVLLCVTIAAGSCKPAEEQMATSTDVQTQSAQQGNMPVTVTGCLKAGQADDMLVLTTARAEGSGDAATYQLVGDETAALREHVGRRIEISGTVQAQQEMASRTTARPEDRPTGTSGTPAVQTRTEVEIKRLAVKSAKPLDEKCD
jgi:hypothetical protein